MKNTSKITLSQRELLATLKAPAFSSHAANPKSKSTSSGSQISSKKCISPKRACAAAAQLARELSVLEALQKRLHLKYLKMLRLSVP